MSDFESAFCRKEVMPPCRLYDLASVEGEDAASVEYQIQNLQHFISPPVVFRNYSVQRPLWLYERKRITNFKPLCDVSTADDDDVKEFMQLVASSNLERETEFFAVEHANGMNIRELRALGQKKYAYNHITIVDFELYEQAKNSFAISEIGACKIVDGKLLTLHCILAPPEQFNNYGAAKYVSRNITGIPITKHRDIEYQSKTQAVKQLREFMKDEPIVFAKGKHLESQIFAKLQIPSYLEEIYPLLCYVKGFRIYDALCGQRCAFHQTLPGKTHCALEDATEWGAEFLK